MKSTIAAIGFVALALSPSMKTDYQKSIAAVKTGTEKRPQGEAVETIKKAKPNKPKKFVHRNKGKHQVIVAGVDRFTYPYFDRRPRALDIVIDLKPPLLAHEDFSFEFFADSHKHAKLQEQMYSPHGFSGGCASCDDSKVLCTDRDDGQTSYVHLHNLEYDVSTIRVMASTYDPKGPVLYSLVVDGKTIPLPKACGCTDSKCKCGTP